MIDGKWKSAQTEQLRTIINPYNKKTIALVTESGREVAQEAITAARIAFDSGECSNTTVMARANIVRTITMLVDRDAEELAHLETLDTGKTLVESRWDMEDVAGVFRYYADIADQSGGDVIPSPILNSVSKVVYEPVGVCAQITP